MILQQQESKDEMTDLEEEENDDNTNLPDKYIIFSQWTEMLEIVAEALKMNSMLFTTCFNRKKDFESKVTGIEIFRNSSQIRILLLHNCNARITLLRAS
jgi:hypothetical protein